jgi:hypothetical protein
MSGTIFTQQVFVVVQTWRNSFMPDYELFDQSWRQIGTARRAEREGLKKLSHNVDPGPLFVYDAGDRLLFSADFNRPHERPAVFLADANGDEIGWVIRMGGLVKPVFDLEHGGRRLGSLEVTDWRQSLTYVRDEEERAVAEIRPLDEDAPIENPDETEGYYLTMVQEIADPLRTLVVGCGVILEALVGSESFEPTLIRFTSPGIPAIKDRLKAMFRK